MYVLLLLVNLCVCVCVWFDLTEANPSRHEYRTCLICLSGSVAQIKGSSIPILINRYYHRAGRVWNDQLCILDLNTICSFILIAILIIQKLKLMFDNIYFCLYWFRGDFIPKHYQFRTLQHEVLFITPTLDINIFLILCCCSNLLVLVTQVDIQILADLLTNAMKCNFESNTY